MQMILFALFVAIVLGFLMYRKQIEKKMFVLLLLVNILGAGVSAWEFFETDTQGITEIERQSQGDAGQIPMIVETDSGESYEITLNVPYEQYTEEEAEKELNTAMKQLDQTILGKNQSWNEICWNMSLPESIEGSSVSIIWYTNKPDVLDANGVIHASDENGTEVILMADLSLQESSINYQRTVTVFPSKEEGSFVELIRKTAEQMNANHKKGTFYLPEQIQGKNIKWYRQKQKVGGIFSVLALIIGVMWIARNKENEKDAAKKRDEQMLRDYPALLNKLQLYLHAGLSMRKVLERVEQSYLQQKRNGNGEKRYAYEEIVWICQQMRSGMTEYDAYAEFGQRCKLPCYKGLALMLSQNLKRGGAGLLNQLERESAEAFENRKREAKMEGERAGVKLLVPMCLMLLVVMALVMIPAMLQF